MDKNFVGLLYQTGAKHYRFGPIAGRVDVLDGGSALRFKHYVPFGWGEERRNTSNWFGVSVYHPDWITKLPCGAQVHMSLNGMTCPYSDDFRALFDAMAVRYVRIERGGAVLWESWTGEIPSDEQISRMAL